MAFDRPKVELLVERWMSDSYHPNELGSDLMTDGWLLKSPDGRHIARRQDPAHLMGYGAMRGPCVLLNTAAPVDLREQVHKVLRELGYLVAPVSFAALRAAKVDWTAMLGIIAVDVKALPHDLIEVLFYARNESNRYGVVHRQFLSGYDTQETPPLYFLSQLPSDSLAHSVDQAYKLLKPYTVLVAEERGRKVMRQGDIFAIELPTLKLPEGFASYTNWRVAGTNHVVQEALVFTRTNNVVTLGRGMLLHQPEGRPPDHHPLHLGNHWHVLVPNRVPAAAPTDQPLFEVMRSRLGLSFRVPADPVIT